MRDVYYQSAGNPLQQDRLPETKSSVELLAEPWRVGAWHNPLWMMAYGALALVLLLLYKAMLADHILHPFDLLIAPPLIIGCLLISRWNGRHRDLLLSIAIVATAVINLNPWFPWLLQLTFFSSAFGLLVYLFGMHATVMLTAPPVRRHVSRQVRMHSHRTLKAVALGSSISAAVLILIGSPVILGLAILMLVILPVLTWWFPPVVSWRVVWRQYVSWFCYDPPVIPGVLRSPAGSLRNRAFLMLLASILMSIVLARGPLSPVHVVRSVGNSANKALLEQVAHPETQYPATRYPTLAEMDFLWILVFAVSLSFVLLTPISVVLLLGIPMIRQVADMASQHMASSHTECVLDTLRYSPSAIDRNSMYFGRVVHDGSPVLVPRNILGEHAHGLGDSGSGKTSLFLCPTIEQLIDGECSVIVLDLKADSLELLATLKAASDRLRDARGRQVPLKYFSNQPNCPTFAFNPMTQPFWDSFDLQTRTDILCAANGLNYGTDYGAGYFSSANAAVLHQTLRTFPEVRTFQELAECIGTVITTAKKRDLHPEIRKAGVHVQEVMKRLAGCDPLNVTSQTGHPSDVVANAIDLTEAFRSPQLMYFHLSATLSPSGASEIARLVTYMLLAAATQTERKQQVYLVIDEFQRIVANNLEYMLQLARSMGVGVILANQSMEDLKKGGVNLIPAIEANCRLRQWFSVSSSEDRERLIRNSGETIDVTQSVRTDKKSDGTSSIGVTTSEILVPRITMNDILLMSDHPFRSILRISRSAGYAQYGGFPFIIESGYHISPEEYRRRCRLSWPSLDGAYVPNKRAIKPQRSAAASGPQVTRETIDRSASATPDQIEEFFRGVEEEFRPQPETNPRRKRRKKGDE